jgi:hypothetical protein
MSHAVQILHLDSSLPVLCMLSRLLVAEFLWDCGTFVFRIKQFQEELDEMHNNIKTLV